MRVRLGFLSVLVSSAILASAPARAYTPVEETAIRAGASPSASLPEEGLFSARSLRLSALARLAGAPAARRSLVFLHAARLLPDARLGARLREGPRASG